MVRRLPGPIYGLIISLVSYCAVTAKSAIAVSPASEPSEIGLINNIEVLKRVATPAWQRLVESDGVSQGELNFTEVHNTPQSPTRDVSIVFAVSDGNLKATVRDSNGRTRVSASNPQYVFSITKKNDDSSFGISIVEPCDRIDGLVKEEAQEYRDEILDWAFAHRRILTHSLSDLVTDPCVIIKGVSDVRESGDRLIRVDFSRDNRKNNPRDYYNDSYFLLDPAREWVLRRYRIGMPWGTIEAELTYRSVPNEPPVLERKSELWTMKGVETRRNLKVIRFDHVETPEVEFFLSSFGFPEPIFERTQTGRRWGLALLAGSALLFLLGFFLRQSKDNCHAN